MHLLFTAVQVATISKLFSCFKRKISFISLENPFSAVLVDFLNAQKFEPFLSSTPQPKLSFLWRTLVHSLNQPRKNPRGQLP